MVAPGMTIELHQEVFGMTSSCIAFVPFFCFAKRCCCWWWCALVFFVAVCICLRRCYFFCCSALGLFHCLGPKTDCMCIIVDVLCRNDRYKLVHEWFASAVDEGEIRLYE